MRWPHSGILMLTSVLACSTAAGTRLDDSYSLRRNPKAGEIDSYKTVLKVEGENLNLDMTVASTETVKRVNPDGTYVVASTINSSEVNLNGRQIPLSATGQTVTSTYDRSGRVLKQENTSGGRMNATQLMGLSRMGFAPEESLRVGQVKSYESEFGNEQKEKISGTVTILGIEKAGGDLTVDALKVKNVGDLKSSGPSGEQSMHFDFIAFIDPKSGRLQKTDGTVTGLKLGRGAAGGTMTFKVTRERAGSESK